MDRWCAITVGRKVILLETVLMVLFSCFSSYIEKSEEKLCFICKKPGHIARDCPEKPAAPEGGEA